MPLDVFGAGVGVEPEPPRLLFVAVASPSPRWLATCAVGVGAPEPELCDPFAADVADVSVDESPEARNSAVPTVVKLLAVVAVDE